MTESSQIVHSYSADTAPKGVLRHAVPAWRFPAEAWQHRVLVWNFFRRELLARFRGSIFGIFWVLVQPVFLFAVYYFVFGVLFGARFGGGGDAPDPTFAVYLFAGIILFNPMIEGTNGALRVIVSNGNLVKKVRFPCQLLPLSPVLVSCTVHLVGTLVLLIAGSVFGVIRLGPELLLWPVVTVLLITFSIGVGLILATLFVFARDVQHLYGIVSTAWFLLTPIFWPLSLMEERLPWLVDWLLLNPMYCLVMAFRQVFGIVQAGTAYSAPTSLAENLAWGAGWAFGALFLGYGLFMAKRHKYADLV